MFEAQLVCVARRGEEAVVMLANQNSSWHWWLHLYSIPAAYCSVRVALGGKTPAGEEGSEADRVVYAAAEAML